MDLIVLKGSVRLPRAKPGQRSIAVSKGGTIPPRSLSSEDVERLLKAGIVGPRAEPAVEKAGLPPTKGKWCRDPADLAGLSVRELLAAVLEIDPEFHGGEEFGEAALVQLLTADFDQVFRQPGPPASSDRVRPAAPALARARAKAEGK